MQCYTHRKTLCTIQVVVYNYKYVRMRIQFLTCIIRHLSLRCIAFARQSKISVDHKQYDDNESRKMFFSQQNRKNTKKKFEKKKTLKKQHTHAIVVVPQRAAAVSHNSNTAPGGRLVKINPYSVAAAVHCGKGRARGVR